MSALLALPLLPLAGFLVNGLLGRRLPAAAVAGIACALPAAAFVLTLVLSARLGGDTTALSATAWTWAATGTFSVDVSFWFDAVTALMCLVITGIGTLIHVYSIGYMHGDAGYARYFAYLNLFLFFMLVLVLGGNLVITFVGWEGVGLASYLLIGFWFEDPAKTAAGLKAFVVNRAGDTAFLAAAFVAWHYAGTLDFQALNAWFGATGAAAGGGAPGVATAVGVLLLLGACGKSAQIPLHVWLPDAMAGPTPVSALIHAATMVTAGVYLLARLHGVYAASPDAQHVVIAIGAATAFAGATLGTAQYNLKKVLAYSTMSQLGLMVMACGLGGWSVALFHLYTHAFFKACLFLAAGAVLHALHGEEDMRRMGGLARPLRFTFVVFMLGTLALCGVPPFAGFFSKDEIVWLAWAAPAGSPWLWAVASATSLLTAFYMFRAAFMTFGGTSRVSPDAAGRLHDAPPTMAVPLAVLALGAVVGGFVGLPHEWRDALDVTAPFFDLVEPIVGAAALAPGSHGASLFAGIAVLVAFAGFALACLRYGRGATTARVNAASPLRRTLEAGYFVDALYDRLVRGLDAVSSTLLGRGTEPLLGRVGLDAAAGLGRVAAAAAARLQSGNLQSYLVYALAGLALVLAVAWGNAHG
jgi:NADH-quinone oxidoreductase subunit L